VKKILLIEDNLNFAKFFTNLFKKDPIIVEHLIDTKDLLKTYYNNRYDLVVTDLLLPEVKGNYLVSQIKEINEKQLIAILTSHPSDIELVKGFDAGADEFFAKDVPREVLRQRILNLLALNARITEYVYSEQEDVRLDIINKRVYKHNERIKMTFKEFDLLLFFIENKNEILTRERIIRDVWDDKYDGIMETRTIDAHVKNIREKLDVSCLMSIRCQGYRWYES